MILFVMKHGRIFPPHPIVRLGFIGMIILAVAAVIGTHARTGLVGMAVFAVILWIMSDRKILYAGLLAVSAAVIVVSAPASWTERMSTIFAADEERDSSAAVRLLVWKWTIDFAIEHPLGGGFNAWKADQIVLKTDEDANTAKVQEGVAFHSSLFEVLGEHGWIGLGIVLALIYKSFTSLLQVSRLARASPHLAWARDLSKALFTALTVLLACGLFTDMGFHPTYYCMFALCYSLREYVRRVKTSDAVGEPTSLGIGPAVALPVAHRRS